MLMVLVVRMPLLCHGLPDEEPDQRSVSDCGQGCRNDGRLRSANGRSEAGYQSGPCADAAAARPVATVRVATATKNHTSGRALIGCERRCTGPRSRWLPGPHHIAPPSTTPMIPRLASIEAPTAKHSNAAATPSPTLQVTSNSAPGIAATACQGAA